MSQRHQASRSANPGAAHIAPSKEERKAEHRKARHRTNELLARADEELGDELITPRPVHSTVEVDPSEVPKPEKGDARPSREYRHWKQKFWKRRKNERARKAAIADER